MGDGAMRLLLDAMSRASYVDGAMLTGKGVGPRVGSCEMNGWMRLRLALQAAKPPKSTQPAEAHTMRGFLNLHTTLWTAEKQVSQSASITDTQSMFGNKMPVTM